MEQMNELRSENGEKDHQIEKLVDDIKSLQNEKNKTTVSQVIHDRIKKTYIIENKN